MTNKQKPHATMTKKIKALGDRYGCLETRLAKDTDLQNNIKLLKKRIAQLKGEGRYKPQDSFERYLVTESGTVLHFGTGLRANPDGDIKTVEPRRTVENIYEFGSHRWEYIEHLDEHIGDSAFWRSTLARPMDVIE